MGNRGQSPLRVARTWSTAPKEHSRRVRMPRKPRFYLPGAPAHIVQGGHTREPVVFESDDCAAYLGWLGEGRDATGVRFIPTSL
jgi:hypothetical protein